MHRIAVFLIIFGVAEVSLGSPRMVTEAEFLAALDTVHPAVAESSEALALARARVVAAATLENPVLGLEREDPSGPEGETAWTLSWQLPETGRRQRIAAREETAAAAAARLEQRLLALRLTMKEIYAEWALASARHRRLAAQADRVEALAAREHERARRGEASGLEARRLDLAASGLRTRVALADAAAEQARARAAGWSPLPPGARPVLPALPAAVEPARDHPLVRAAEKDLAAATLEREAAGRFVRSPEISLGWQRQETAGTSIGGPILGVAWSVPVLARGGAEKAASEARVSGARARLERIQRQLEAARSGARLSWMRLAAAASDAEAVLAGNERMLDGAEAAFRHGEVSLTDLLETHRSVTESELAVLDLRQAALAAYRELERVTGPSLTASGALQPDPRNPHQESHP